MKIAIFNIKDYEKPYFTAADQGHTFCFIPQALSLATVSKTKGWDGICCFVTDCLNSAVIKELAENGVKLIALRSAGFDHVDVAAAQLAGITVVRVPKYSPEAIAEFAAGLILVLSRKILTSYLRGLEYNFSLEGLMGFNLHEKTVGIVGTGNTGTAFAKIMKGFGCHVLATDPVSNAVCDELNVQYVALDQLLRESDILSLHCPLNEKNIHMINESTLSSMKPGAMLINTGRGGLCDTKALIDALESGQLGYAGLDVYENERGLFFTDHRSEKIQDEQFIKLQSLPNVLITPHQAFLTQEAVENIIKTTVENITAFEQGKPVNII